MAEVKDRIERDLRNSSGKAQSRHRPVFFCGGGGGGVMLAFLSNENGPYSSVLD